MTDQEINIAVAELLGCSLDEINKRLDWELAERELAYGTIGINEYYRRHLRVDPEPPPINDYCNDLNACHEMEAFIPSGKRGYYNAELAKVVCKRTLSAVVKEPEFIFKLIRASERQRCEAFLRVHGKWKEPGQ